VAGAAANPGLPVPNGFEAVPNCEGLPKEGAPPKLGELPKAGDDPNTGEAPNPPGFWKVVTPPKPLWATVPEDPALNGPEGCWPKPLPPNEFWPKFDCWPKTDWFWFPKPPPKFCEALLPKIELPLEPKPELFADTDEPPKTFLFSPPKGFEAVPKPELEVVEEPTFRFPNPKAEALVLVANEFCWVAVEENALPEPKSEGVVAAGDPKTDALEPNALLVVGVAPKILPVAVVTVPPKIDPVVCPNDVAEGPKTFVLPNVLPDEPNPVLWPKTLGVFFEVSKTDWLWPKPALAEVVVFPKIVDWLLLPNIDDWAWVVGTALPNTELLDDASPKIPKAWEGGVVDAGVPKIDDCGGAEVTSAPKTDVWFVVPALNTNDCLVDRVVAPKSVVEHVDGALPNVNNADVDATGVANPVVTDVDETPPNMDDWIVVVAVAPNPGVLDVDVPLNIDASVVDDVTELPNAVFVEVVEGTPTNNDGLEPLASLLLNVDGLVEDVPPKINPVVECIGGTADGWVLV
jgi:hypothetical protein